MKMRTLNEAAEALGTTRHRIRRGIQAGRYPSMQWGSRLLVDLELQLSLASGVPQQTISAIESGERRNPGVLTIRKLADAMECSIDELYPAECDDEWTEVTP